MHGSLWGTGVARGRQTLYTWLERLLGRGTDVIFTVNPEDAEDCTARARVPKSRIVTLPAGGAGVDPRFFLDESSARLMRHEVREEFGLEPHDTVIAYIGRTVAAKGMGVLARAFRRLCQQQSHVKLLMVGEPLRGDRRPYSEQRFRRELGAGVAEHLRWAGYRDPVWPLVAAADIIALPSLREGFGMSLAEAAAVGRPVVASQTRGARAVVEHGTTGLLVPVGDSLALAEALLSLVRERERRERMGGAARRRALERFSRDAVIRAYLERYQALANGSAP